MPHPTVSAEKMTLDRDELQEHITGSYFGLRVGLMAIGFALPVVLIGGGLAADVAMACDPICRSISAYYNSGVPLLRDVFVGSIIAMAALLISYRGFSPAEDRMLNGAGALAVVVAFVPTPSPLHVGAAVGLFVLVGLVCIRRAGDTLRLLDDAEAEQHYRAAYKVIGSLMIILPLSAWVIFEFAGAGIGVLAAEALAIWVFGLYWLVKSDELRRTHAERQAAAGELRVEAAAPEPAGPAPKRAVAAAFQAAFGERNVVRAAPDDRLA